jgi:hypothetical protein
MSPATPTRQPLGNRLVLAMLKSRWHHLLSGSTLQLTLRGRRTGRVLRLPVQYARDGDRLVVLPAHAERKRWWRNLTDPSPVSVLLAGRDHAGRARTLNAGTAAFDGAAAAYARRFPKAARLAATSPVLVTVDLTPAHPQADPAAPGVDTGHPPTGRRAG